MNLRHVTTKYVYDVNRQLVLRDKKRNKFRPEVVTVAHRSDLGWWQVRVFGHKVGPAGWGTEAVWSIKDGQIEATNDSRPPQWLRDIVAGAIAQHGGESEVQAPSAQATGDLCRCAWLGTDTPEHVRSGLCLPVVTR
ncbi:hypothetical protein [Actinoplanes palleronii]|uniref:SH3 domain-containing protein n=1 Tax=Actinoplanes palleronii TaxID=113570 RepID=A0ABQ4B3X8_9ACTN|nr:hypothetical protein [Actinoplanes palleronii]GIE65374.1 hypothetical protein Apa02nite_014820 [Actinoplanes palleronii]